VGLGGEVSIFPSGSITPTRQPRGNGIRLHADNATDTSRDSDENVDFPVIDLPTKLERKLGWSWGGSFMTHLLRSVGASGPSTGAQSNQANFIPDHLSRDGDGNADCLVNYIPTKEDKIVSLPCCGLMMEVVCRSVDSARSTAEGYHTHVIPDHVSRDGGTVACLVTGMPTRLPSRSTSCGDIVEEEFSHVEQIEVEYLTSINHSTRDKYSPIHNKSKTAPPHPSLTNFKRGRGRHGRLDQSFQASLQRNDHKSPTVQSSIFARTIHEAHNVHRVSDEMSAHFNSKTAARNVARTNNSKTDEVMTNLCDTSIGVIEIEHLPSKRNVSTPTKSKANGAKVNSTWRLGISRRNFASTSPSAGPKRGRVRHGSLDQSFQKSLQKTVPKTRATTVEPVKLERILEETNVIHRVSKGISSRGNSEIGAYGFAPSNNSKTDGVVVNSTEESGARNSEIAAHSFAPSNKSKTDGVVVNPTEESGARNSEIGAHSVAPSSNSKTDGVVVNPAGESGTTEVANPYDISSHDVTIVEDCARIVEYGKICIGGIIAGRDPIPFTTVIGEYGEICQGGSVAVNDFTSLTTSGGTIAEANSLPCDVETSSKNRKILVRYEV
jgi:hypothetical protein